MRGFPPARELRGGGPDRRNGVRIRRWLETGCGAKGFPHPWTPAPYRGTGHAFDRRSDELGVCFRSNRSCRLPPARQGMKSRSCGLVQRIGAADSATPHPDPSGGQAPRLAKSSTALHFLIPPSTIGLQIGTFRRWRAGIEVDWRAHPGSESGMCFRSNRSCLLAPAHQGMKVNAGYPLGSRLGVRGMPSSAGITRWGPEWRVGRL